MTSTKALAEIFLQKNRACSASGRGRSRASYEEEGDGQWIAPSATGKTKPALSIPSSSSSSCSTNATAVAPFASSFQREPIKHVTPALSVPADEDDGYDFYSAAGVDFGPQKVRQSYPGGPGGNDLGPQKGRHSYPGATVHTAVQTGRPPPLAAIEVRQVVTSLAAGQVNRQEKLTKAGEQGTSPRDAFGKGSFSAFGYDSFMENSRPLHTKHIGVGTPTVGSQRHVNAPLNSSSSGLANVSQQSQYFSRVGEKRIVSQLCNSNDNYEGKENRISLVDQQLNSTPIEAMIVKDTRVIHAATTAEEGFTDASDPAFVPKQAKTLSDEARR